MNLFFCGDIMPGGVLPYQNSYISSELLRYMKSFDFRIGTLESAIGTGLPFDPIKMAGRQNIVYARDEDFFRIKDMGFDVVSLANNHVWDLGKEGLRNTINVLNTNGIKYCGAGMDLREASCPAVLEKDGLTVAIFAYCMFNSPWLGYVELAGEDKAGVNALIIDKVIADIKDAKKRYNYVIVMPHWGREYQYEPLPECIAMAKQMIKAGADAVLGSHTHQIQPLVFHKGKPICYCMGNFMFPDFYMRPPRPIWYPVSIDEVKNVKDVVGYPFPIEFPIRQVWNPVSRYGCVVSLELNENEAKTDFRYVHSSEDNIESSSDLSPQIRYQLMKARRFVSDTPYRIAVRARRKIRRFIERIQQAPKK